MNAKQRKTVDEQIRKGCQTCGNRATMLVVWSFEDTANMVDDPHIIAFICCDDHVDEIRAQRPQSPPHIFVRITEEALKPLVFQ